MVVLLGHWLTKRRGIILTPLFLVALTAARWAPHLWIELAQDLGGLSLLFAGTGLRLLAASYHESSHHAEPITAGPYAWVRHPLYLSNFLLGLGIVLIAGWWPMILVYCLIFLPIHAVIARAEEIHLTTLYRERYAAYRQAVPALFPWRRYTGFRYGSRSEFKLRKGKERLKAIGYLTGMAGVLLVKQLRQSLHVPPLHPLSPMLWAFYLGVASLAIIFRTKTRSAWMRAGQTVLASLCILILAIHLPGVWPAPSKEVGTSSPIAVGSVLPPAAQQASSKPVKPVRRGIRPLD